jgi:ATP/maltotriose-dependent transcriptional regulator MalT
VNDFVAWVAANLPAKQFLFAIDNLDECVGVPEIAAFLARLVELTRSRVRWVFASRGIPHTLPLATWLAYNESDLPIGPDELQVTHDEATQLATACNVSVDEAGLQRILDLTDGWPVAVCLALRFSPASAPSKLTGQTQEWLYAYLEQRVWHVLDADTQNFLFRAAFLPHFNLSTISLAGFAASDKIMYQISSQIGLVTKSGGNYELYRVFRDFICAHLANQGRERLIEAREAAGAVLELLDSPIEALERYVDASAFDSVDRILTRHNFGLIEKGHIDLVERALRVPNTASSPAALALRAAIDESRGRLNSAEALYSRALQHLIDGSHLRVAISWRYSLLLYQQGRSDAMPLLQELYNRQDLEDSDRAHVAGSLAMLLALAGDHQHASVVIDEAIGIANATDDQLRARTLGRASTVAFFAGDAERVESFATEAALIARDNGLHSLAARITTSLSSLHTSSGRIDIAASYARQVVEHAKKGGDSQLRARGLRELLALEAELGNEAAIVAIKVELCEDSYDGPVGFIGQLVARGMQLIWRSQFDAAIELLSAHATNLSPHQHRVRISLWAVAAAAAGRASSLSSALQEYSSAASDDWDDQPMFDRERALSLNYIALALLVSRNHRRAREFMDQAASLCGGSSQFGAVLEAVFVRSIAATRSALETLDRRNQGGVAKIILSTTEGLFQPEPVLTHSLTPSEIAVLRAVGDGLSNKAIAALKGRTVNTVRSQVSSILQKLKCETRGEAVAVARRQGLL